MEKGSWVMLKENMSDVNERVTDLYGSEVLLNNNRAYKTENVRNKMC